MGKKLSKEFPADKYIPSQDDIDNAPISPAIQHFHNSVVIDDTLPDADDLAVESLVLKSENVTLKARVAQLESAYNELASSYVAYKAHVLREVRQACPMLIHEGRL